MKDNLKPYKAPNMSERTLRRMNRLLILTGAIAALSCRNGFAEEEFVDPPEDQSATLGETVTFSVEPRHAGLAFQWLRQWPDRTEILNGETGNHLTLTNAAISDVGLYSCAIAFGEQVQLTRAASLTLWTPVAASAASNRRSATSAATRTLGEDEFIVYGAPTAANGGTSGCPGPYAGYATYRKTVALGWGWAPSTNTTVHTATDITRSDTRVTYTGNSLDAGCQQTTVTAPHPPISTKYRFTVYFPTNCPSTNAYPLRLSGFKP